jgi:WD40 repeat protein
MKTRTLPLWFLGLFTLTNLVGMVCIYLAGLYILPVIVGYVTNPIRECNTLTSHDGSISVIGDLAFSPDDQMLAVSFYNRTAIYQPIDGTLLHILDTDFQSHCSMYHPDGKRIFLGCPSRTPDNYYVQLWDVETQSLIRTFQHKDTRDIALSSDGAMLATASNTNGLRLWDTEEGSLLRQLDNGAYKVAFHPDGDQLAAASYADGKYQIRLWDVYSGEALHTAYIADAIKAMIFTPNGKELIAATENGALYWWNTVDGTVLRVQEFSIRNDDIRYSSFSPEADIWVARHRYSMDLWNTEDATMLFTYPVPRGRYPVFSNDMTMLAFSYSYDVKICPMP